MKVFLRCTLYENFLSFLSPLQAKPRLQREGSCASLHNSLMRNSIFQLMIHTLDPLSNEGTTHSSYIISCLEMIRIKIKKLFVFTRFVLISHALFQSLPNLLFQDVSKKRHPSFTKWPRRNVKKMQSVPTA